MFTQNSAVFLAGFVSKALSPSELSNSDRGTLETTKTKGKDYARLCYFNVVFLINKVNPQGRVEFEIIFVDCLCRADRERSLVKTILVESVRTKRKGERDWSVTYSALCGRAYK